MWMCLEGPVFGGVAGDAVVSAAPDLVEPGVGEDAYGVGVVVAAGEGAVVEVVGGPGVGSAGVAGEVADGVAQLFATGPTESDRAHLARLSGGGRRQRGRLALRWCPGRTTESFAARL